TPCRTSTEATVAAAMPDPTMATVLSLTTASKAGTSRPACSRPPRRRLRVTRESAGGAGPGVVAEQDPRIGPGKERQDLADDVQVIQGPVALIPSRRQVAGALLQADVEGRPEDPPLGCRGALLERQPLLASRDLVDRGPEAFVERVVAGEMLRTPVE